MEIEKKSRIVALDHRRFPRKILDNHLLGLLVVGGKTYPTKVVDYSPRGVSLELDEAILEKAEQQNFEVELRFDQTSFSGTIRHSHKGDHKIFAGVSIKNLDPKKEVSFTDVDPGWDLVEDAETLKNLFNDLTFKGPEVLCKLRQIQGQAQVFAKEVRGNELILEVFGPVHGKLLEGFCSLRFEMFQTCHALDSRVTGVEGNIVSISIPQKIARLLRRETVRVLNGTNDHRISIHLESSVFGKTSIDMDVYDFSEHGISILDPDLWLHVPPGVPIEKIVLTSNSGKKINGKGTIKGHSWVKENGSHATGIFFETTSTADRNNWHNFILESRYPALSFEYKNQDHKEVWELFDRSKYLGLKPRESFDYVFDITKDTWEKLNTAGTKISKRVLMRGHDKMLGHLQIDRIYPETWCAHALAIDPSVFKTVGKDIYAITADVLSAEGSNYIISITESHLSWNQRNYYDFVKHYRFPEHNELKIFQIHEADMNAGWNLDKYPGLETRVSNKFDVARILKYFEINSSLLEREALGLNERYLDLQSLNEEYQKYSLNRKREFVIGYLNGEFVGFACLETGTTGLSIFGIQDTMYVFIDPSVLVDRLKIYDALLLAGLERYREYGVPTVNIYVPEMRREELSGKGLKFIWEGVRWISKRETAKRFHSYIQNMYGHLILKRENIRKRRTTD